jgi:hypothetical protein
VSVVLLDSEFLPKYDPRLGLHLLTIGLLKCKLTEDWEDIVDKLSEAKVIFAISDAEERSLYKDCELLVSHCQEIVKGQAGSEEEIKHEEVRKKTVKVVDELLPILADVLCNQLCLKSWRVFTGGNF